MRAWLLILLVMAGCISPVELDLPGGYQPKIVVNSEFTPDGDWTVVLHRSAAIGNAVDWQSQYITDATVKITDSEGFTQVLRHSWRGIYQNPLGRRPMALENYVLEVTAPSLPAVSATSGVPALSAELGSIEEIRAPEVNEDGEYEVQLRLDDNAGSHKYGIVVDRLWLSCWEDRKPVSIADGGATAYGGGRFDSSFPSLRDFASLVEDPSEPYFPEDEFYGVAWFSDDLFEQESIDLKLTLKSPHEPELAPHFRVTVMSYSPELWEYEVSLSRDYQFEVNFFSDRPASVYSNIENGLGVFGGLNRVSFMFDSEGNTWSESDLRVGQECESDAG